MFISTFFKRSIVALSIFIIPTLSFSQVKILFDNVKGETSGTTADWTIDADLHNINWGTNGSAYTCTSCTHSNPQQIPTPAQSTITATSAETTWTGALSSWGIDLVRQGYTVESLPYTGAITYGNSSNAQDLSHYKVFIMCEPNTVLTTAEKTALVSFVQNGGGLYMISDHNGSDRNFDGWDSPHIWMDFANSTSNVFGIIADTVTVSPTITTFPTLPNDSCLHGPLGTVTGLKYHQGTTFTIYPTVNSSVKGIAYNSGTSGNTGVLAGHSRYGRGKVAFIGDSSPFDDGTGNTNSTLSSSYATDENGSHRILIVNTTIWLASTDSASLAILPFDSTAICKGDSVTLTASGATGYTWSPGGATTAAIRVSPAATTTYSVSGPVGGTTQTQSVVVKVNNRPTALFTTSIANKTLTVTNQTTNGISYVWNYGDGTATVTGNSPAAHTYTTNGTYTVMLIATNSCGSDTLTHSVSINGISVTPGSATICSGQLVILTASGGSSYLWSPGGDTTAAITVSPTITTTYTVSGVVNSATLSQSVIVTVTNVPVAAFTASVSARTVTISDQSTGTSTYIWNFGDGTTTVSGNNPAAHTYAANGTYSIQLIATNNCGSDTTSHQVIINVTGIEQVEAASVKIYQSNLNEVKIEYPSGNQDKSIAIYNISGQLVLEKTAENYQSTEIVNISSLAQGIYILRAAGAIRRFIK
jgi:PKD repeat protein